MKQKHTHQTILALGLMFISRAAFAVPGASQLSTVQTWMIAIGAIIVTLALMYVALKMTFQKMPFHEVSHVFWGGILFGAAPMIGGMLIAG